MSGFDRDVELEHLGVRRYEDPLSPQQLILCDASCETVRGDTAASLGIQFACEQVIVIPD